MMLKSGVATLIVVTSIKGCKVDNIDRSDIATFTLPSMAECEQRAAVLDPKRGQRALCFEGAMTAVPKP
jgi:hypothetical protein